MQCACCMLSCFSCVWLFVTLRTIALQAHCPWNSPGKNTGVGCHFLLQGTFLNQGSNPWLLFLLHCRWILNHWAAGGAPYNTDSVIFYLQLEEGVQHAVTWSACRGRTAWDCAHGTAGALTWEHLAFAAERAGTVPWGQVKGARGAPGRSKVYFRRGDHMKAEETSAHSWANTSLAWFRQLVWRRK